MCGTSLEADHALINPHAVIGYPTGMQATPVRLRLSLSGGMAGGHRARPRQGRRVRGQDYDQLVDSPILLGRLTTAQTRVTGVPVEIYTYSETDKITSSQLLARDERHAPGRRPVPGHAAGGPLHLPLPLRRQAGRGVGALAQLGVRAQGIGVHRLGGQVRHRHRGARVLPHRDAAQYPQRDHRALQLRDAGALAAPLALRGNHRMGGAHHAAPGRAQDTRRSIWRR